MGCTIFPCASILYLGNISMTDGQHVILMLRLWQQLKVTLRCSCKRQHLGVIKQEALRKKIKNLVSLHGENLFQSRI